MSALGMNIRALRKLYGEGRDITQTELARIAGVSRETVNKWESGSIESARGRNLNRICEHFDITVDDLRSQKNGLAARLAKELSGEDEAKPSQSNAHTIPLLSRSDVLQRRWDGTGERLEVPLNVYSRHPQAFALVAPDSSMGTVFPKGCYIVVERAGEPQSGAIIVAKVASAESELLVRRYYRGSGTAMLCAEGLESVDDLVCSLNDVCSYGRVVWYQAAGEL